MGVVLWRGNQTLLAAAAALMLGSAPAAHARGKTVSIPPLTAQGLPNVQSASALVIDLDTGTIVYGKNPDDIRHIASTSKIFTALAVRRRNIDLEAATTITMDDARAARGGSRTRLDVGEAYTHRDLLIAMLVASDNRAPTALGRAVGLDARGLVAEMNAVARDLGLDRTHFDDPSGLNGNTSTAREMAIGLRAALADPVLAEILATRRASIERVSHKRRRVLHYGNTNRLLFRDRYGVLGGKTGFTNPAGYCLISASQIGERRVAFVFLGSEGELTRYGDFSRVWGWMDTNGLLPKFDEGEAVADDAARDPDQLEAESAQAD